MSSYGYLNKEYKVYENYGDKTIDAINLRIPINGTLKNFSSSNTLNTSSSNSTINENCSYESGYYVNTDKGGIFFNLSDYTCLVMNPYNYTSQETIDYDPTIRSVYQKITNLEDSNITQTLNGDKDVSSVCNFDYSGSGPNDIFLTTNSDLAYFCPFYDSNGNTNLESYSVTNINNLSNTVKYQRLSKFKIHYDYWYSLWGEYSKDVYINYQSFIDYTKYDKKYFAFVKDSSYKNGPYISRYNIYNSNGNLGYLGIPRNDSGEILSSSDYPFVYCNRINYPKVTFIKLSTPSYYFNNDYLYISNVPTGKGTININIDGSTTYETTNNYYSIPSNLYYGTHTLNLYYEDNLIANYKSSDITYQRISGSTTWYPIHITDYFDSYTQSDTLTASYTNTLSAPSISTPSRTGCNTCSINWNGVSDANSYQLQVSTDNSNWSDAYNGTSTSYTYTASNPGTHYFRVRAVWSSDASGDSSWSSTSISLGILDAPTVSSISVHDVRAADVTWGAVSYASSYLVDDINNGDTDITIYQAPGTHSHTLQAIATNSAWNSSITSFNVTTSALTQPIDCSATKNNPDNYTASFTLPSNATGYSLTYSNTSGSVTQTDSKVLSNLPLGSVSYSVIAIYSNDTSYNSSATTYTFTTSKLDDISNISSTPVYGSTINETNNTGAANKKIIGETISWSAVNYATNYAIYDYNATTGNFETSQNAPSTSTTSSVTYSYETASTGTHYLLIVPQYANNSAYNSTQDTQPSSTHVSYTIIKASLHAPIISQASGSSVITINKNSEDTTNPDYYGLRVLMNTTGGDTNIFKTTHAPDSSYDKYYSNMVFYKATNGTLADMNIYDLLDVNALNSSTKNTSFDIIAYAFTYNDIYANSGASNGATYDVYKLATPSNETHAYSDDSLYLNIDWSAVSNASSYTINSNNVSYTSSTNSLHNAIPRADWYTNIIKAIGSTDTVHTPYYINSNAYQVSYGVIPNPSNVIRNTTPGSTQYVTWSAVSGVSGYYIYDGYSDIGEKLSTPRKLGAVYTTSVNLFNSDSFSCDVGPHDIKVQAFYINGSTTAVSDIVDATNGVFTIIKLDTPSISFESSGSSKLTWNAVNTTITDVYRLTIGGVIKNITGTTYTIVPSDVNSSVGDYIITIQAIDNDDDFMYRDSDIATCSDKYYIKKLDIPDLAATTDYYNKTTHTLSWKDTSTLNSSIGSNLAYIVYLNGSGNEIIYGTTNWTNKSLQFSESSLSSSNTAYVVAEYYSQVSSNNPYYITSDASYAITFGKLDTPVLTLTDNIVSWLPISNVYYYNIYNGNTLIASTSSTSYTLTTNDEEITYVIYVKAIAKDALTEDSALSASVSFSFIRCRANTSDGIIATSMDENYTLSWDDVTYADYYEIYMNDTMIGTSTVTSYNFADVYKTGCGSYSFYVKACSNNIRYLKSQASYIIRRTLTAPSDYMLTINNKYVHALNNGWTIALDKNEEMESGSGAYYDTDGTENYAYSSAHIDVFGYTIDTTTGDKVYNSEPLITYDMLIEKDSVSEIQQGSKCMYLHSLTFIEPTVLLKKVIMPSISITQPKSVAKNAYSSSSSINYYIPDNYIIFNNTTPVVIAKRSNYNYPATTFTVYGLGYRTDNMNMSNRLYDKIEKTQMLLPCLSIDGYKIVSDTPAYSIKIYNGTTINKPEFKTTTTVYPSYARWTLITHDSNESDDTAYNNTDIASRVVQQVYSTNVTSNTHYMNISNVAAGRYDLIYEIADVTSDELLALNNGKGIVLGSSINGSNVFKYKGFKGDYSGDTAGYKLSAMYNGSPNVVLNRTTNRYNDATTNFIHFKVIYRNIRITDSNVYDISSRDENGHSIKDELERIVSRCVEPAYYLGASDKADVSSKYSIDVSNIPDINCPEIQFKAGKSLWDILLELGRNFNGIPRLSTKNIITYDIFDAHTEDEIEVDETNEPEIAESSIDNYANGFISDVYNLVSDNDLDYYPYHDGWITPRSINESDPTVSRLNMGLVLNYPIKFIKSISIKVNGTVYDISGYCVESAVYNAMNNDANGKGLHFYYKDGDNKIYGLGTMSENTKWLAGLGLSNSKYVILNILDDIGVNIYKDDNITFIDPTVFEYQIIYKPIISSRLYTEQFNNDNMPKNIYQNLNPDSNNISDTNFGNSAQTQLERIGNNSINKVYITSNILATHKLGEYIVKNGYKYYANKIILKYNNYNYESHVEYSKNINTINPWYGINANYRPYEISIKNIVDRCLNFNDYCYLTINNPIDVDQSYMKDKVITDVSNGLQGSPSKHLSMFYMTSLDFNKANGLTALIGLSYDSNGNTILSPINYGMIIPATYFITSNSIGYSGKCYDNYSVGVKADSRMKDYTLDTGRYIQSDVKYVNRYGNTPYINLALCDNDSTMTSSSIFPQAEYRDMSTSLTNEILHHIIHVDKDNREALSFNYQLHFIAYNLPTLKLGSGFVQNIYKANDDSSTSKPVIILTDRDYSFRKYYIYSNNDIVIGNPVFSDGYGSYIKNNKNIAYHYIKIANSTIPTTSKKYMVIYYPNESNIIMLQLEIDKATSLPAIYMNFSSEKLGY